MVVTAIGFYNTSCLPDKLPTHWNAQGEIDGYSSKNFVLFFYPAITLFLYLLLIFLPAIDPLRKNYEKFKTPYYFIRLILVIFFAALFFVSIAAGYGLKWDIKYLIIPLISLMFITFGIFMPKIKQNWFVGIKTPWTLGSKEVWEKEVGPIEAVCVTDAELKELIPWLQKKRYIKPDREYLVITNFGAAFTFKGTNND